MSKLVTTIAAGAVTTLIVTTAIATDQGMPHPNTGGGPTFNPMGNLDPQQLSNLQAQRQYAIQEQNCNTLKNQDYSAYDKCLRELTAPGNQQAMGTQSPGGGQEQGKGEEKKGIIDKFTTAVKDKLADFGVGSHSGEEQAASGQSGQGTQQGYATNQGGQTWQGGGSPGMQSFQGPWQGGGSQPFQGGQGQQSQQGFGQGQGGQTWQGGGSPGMQSFQGGQPWQGGGYQPFQGGQGQQAQQGFGQGQGGQTWQGGGYQPFQGGQGQQAQQGFGQNQMYRHPSDPRIGEGGITSGERYLLQHGRIDPELYVIQNANRQYVTQRQECETLKAYPQDKEQCLQQAHSALDHAIQSGLNEAGAAITNVKKEQGGS